MNKPTPRDIAQESRDNLGLPHWYAMITPWQDDGFGGITCASVESNEFVFSFIYEAIDLGDYYATGHA